jgi:aminopeptidase N
MFVHLPLPGAILENPDNEVALTWTTPSGYPTLKVSRNYVNNVLTFTQDGANLRSIPISITYEGKSEKPGQNFDFNLDATTGQFTLSSSSAWYIVNTDRLGLHSGILQFTYHN